MQRVHQLQMAIAEIVAGSDCRTVSEYQNLLDEIGALYWKAVAEKAIASQEPAPEVTSMTVSREAKRQAVLALLQDETFKHATGRTVAAKAGVSPSFVSRVRAEAAEQSAGEAAPAQA